MEPAEQAIPAPLPKPRGLRVVFALAFAAIVFAVLTGGYVFYRSEIDRIMHKAGENLTAIGRLKASQIFYWRNRHAFTSWRLAHGKYLGYILDGSPSPPLPEELRLDLKQQKDPGSEVFLFSNDGRLFLSTSEESAIHAPDPTKPELRKAMDAALARDETVMSDLIAGANGKFYFDSVTAVRNAAGKPTGLLVLRSDASEFLFPIIQDWPLPSETSETLLVRREGDRLVNLNTLRNAPTPPMSRIAGMHETNRPGVQAALGKVGIVSGVDYRGVPVLADVRPVSDSPWFIVSKIDMEEIFADQPRRLVLIGSIVVLIIMLAALVIAFLYKRRQAKIERNLERSEHRFRAYVENAPVGILVSDDRGVFLEANPAAEQISGFSTAELAQKRISDLVHPEDSAATRELLEAVLAQGHAAGDLRHITKDGRVRTWHINAVMPDEHRIVGFVSDVEDQRAAEQIIRLNIRRAEALLKLADAAETMKEPEFMSYGQELAEDITGSCISFIHFVNDNEKTIELVAWSRRTPEKYCHEAFDRHYPVEKAGIWADALRERRAVVINDCASHPNKHGLPEGHSELLRLISVPVMESGKVVMLAGIGNKKTEYNDWDVETVRLIASQIWTLVQRRRDREALARSWESVTNVIEASPVPFAINDEGGRITYVNAAFTRTFGYALEDIPTLEDWWPKAYPDADYREQIKNAWKERNAEAAGAGGQFRPLEAVIHCKDGTFRTVLATAAPLGQHLPGNFIVNLYDITGRKNDETRILTLSRLYLALSQCNNAIVHADSQDELFENVCRIVAEHSGIRMAWIGWADGTEGTLKVRSSHGRGREYLDGLTISTSAAEITGRGPTATAVREGRPIWIQDFANDPMTAPWRERGVSYGWAASAALPLTCNGKTTGVLSIYSDKRDAFDEQSRELFLEIARNVSFAIEGFAREDEKNRAERELQFNRDMLAKVLNSSPQAIFWKDRNSVYMGCNEAFARNAGLATPSDVVGKTDFDLPRPQEDAEAYVAGDTEVMATNTPKLHYEEQLQTADGRRIWIDTSKVPLTDSQGRVYGVLGIVEDITARKAANDELIRLRTAVEQSANIIVITNTEGLITYVNPSFEKSTGYTAAEAIGQNPRIISSGEQDADFYRDLWQTIKSGRSWSGQFHNKRKDGSLYWETATISPVKGEDGRIISFIAVKQDITDRKLLENDLLEAKDRAEAASRAKSEFLAVMSHELRTPLNGVLGFAELLSDTPLNGEQVEFVRTIRSSGKHLLQVVNDILDFSSIEQKGISLEIIPLVLADLVESAAIVIRQSAEEKGLEFRCETAPGTPGIIKGDSLRIRQVLINLLGNAVKFTSSGSVVLRTALASRHNRQFVDFSVQDTGTGIAPGTADILFEPFTQADSTHSRRFKGTGLGLAISMRLAKAMGAELSVESTLGKGSTFTFRLPYVPMEFHIDDEDEDMPEPAPSPPPQRSEETAPGRPVLIVEDDRVSSVLAGKVVSLLGYDVEFAGDGAEAIEVFHPGKYAAILMDMQMPTVSGIEAASKIRAIEGETGAERVPIIALTANVMPGDREQCIAAGMDEFLTKPLDRETLARILGQSARKA